MSATASSESIRLPLQQHPVYMAVLLGFVALFVCGVVAAFSAFTREPILLRNAEDVQRQLDQVLVAGTFDNQPSQEEIQMTLDGKPVHFFRAREGKNVTGIALFAERNGYSGPIKLLVGINDKGVITGARVLSHTETPGLGDNIDLSKSHWILGFTGKDLHHPDDKGWHVKKDGGQFDSFTGATITPRAVVRAIHESLELFQAHKNVFLDQGGQS